MQDSGNSVAFQCVRVTSSQILGHISGNLLSPISLYDLGILHLEVKFRLAPGPDEVPADFHFSLWEEPRPRLVLLLNKLLEIGAFPCICAVAVSRSFSKKEATETISKPGAQLR